MKIPNYRAFWVLMKESGPLEIKDLESRSVSNKPLVSNLARFYLSTTKKDHFQVLEVSKLLSLPYVRRFCTLSVQASLCRFCRG